MIVMKNFVMYIFKEQYPWVNLSQNSIRLTGVRKLSSIAPDRAVVQLLVKQHTTAVKDSPIPKRLKMVSVPGKAPACPSFEYKPVK
jgi:hypothetical protein